MLLAVDIGNSNIKFGIFDGENLHSKLSIPTSSGSSVDELKAAIGGKLDSQIADIIICSVMPEMELPLTHFFRTTFGIEPVFVRNEFDFGLKIDYRPISALGTDRLVNSFSAVEKFGAPFIVCSFGTATTFDIVNREREFVGGLIAPGMKTMVKALHLATAQLPEVEIGKPDSVIGISTIASIQSGIYYGHLAMVEGTIRRIKTEIGDDPKVIATGGFAPLIAENTSEIDIVDENLLLDGLRLLHERIQPA